MYLCREIGLPPMCQWKLAFFRAAHLENNWRLGRYSVVAMMRGHLQRTAHLNDMACNAHLVISAASDGSACLWNLHPLKEFPDPYCLVRRLEASTVLVIHNLWKIENDELLVLWFYSIEWTTYHRNHWKHLIRRSCTIYSCACTVTAYFKWIIWLRSWPTDRYWCHRGGPICALLLPWLRQRLCTSLHAHRLRIGAANRVFRRCSSIANVWRWKRVGGHLRAHQCLWLRVNPRDRRVQLRGEKGVSLA